MYNDEGFEDDLWEIESEPADQKWQGHAEALGRPRTNGRVGIAETRCQSSADIVERAVCGVCGGDDLVDILHKGGAIRSVCVCVWLQQLEHGADFGFWCIMLWLAVVERKSMAGPTSALVLLQKQKGTPSAGSPPDPGGSHLVTHVAPLTAAP